jgi:hypothetical protein
MKENTLVRLGIVICIILITIIVKIVSITDHSYPSMRISKVANATETQVETLDGNLWNINNSAEIGDTVVFNTMRSENIYDDIIIDIL